MMLLRAELHKWWGEKPLPHFPNTLMAALLLLALLFRLPHLISRPLWYDEAFSVLFSQPGPAGMLKGTLTPGAAGSADIHPLLYYTLLWLWSGLFGTSVFAVRSLSVLISLLVLVSLLLLMNRIVSIRAATITGLLFALSPFQIQYAQEARMYGLLSLWLVLSAYFIWRGVHAEDRWPWPAFGVAAALAMYTHVLAIVFLVPLVFTIYIFQRSDRWPRVLLGVGVASLVYLPWALQLPAQLSKVASAYWIERPSLASLFQVVLGFITGLPLSGVQLGIGLFLSLTCVTFLCLILWRVIVLNGLYRRTIIWLVSLAIIPVALLYSISQVQPVFILRGLLPSGVMFLSLAGACLARSWVKESVRVILAAAMLLAFLLGQMAHYQYAGFPYAPFPAVGQFLREEANPGSVILHSNKLTMLPQVYYTEDLPQSYLADIPGSGQDTLARPTQEVLGLLAEPNVLTAVRDADEVYFLIFKQEVMEYEQTATGSHPALLWLQTYYDQTNVMDWGDLRLYTFSLDSSQLSLR
jgi:uncharacterized membrane protein